MSCRKSLLLIAVILNEIISPVSGFTSHKVLSTKTSSLKFSQLDSSFLLNVLVQVPQSQARAEFYFFFFAGSGALGLGFRQVLQLLSELDKLKNIKNLPTLGGPDLDCNPLSHLGYPEKLKEKDVQKIIDTFPSVDIISKNGPKSSYMAQQGYLEREGFEKSLSNCNLLALNAAFSCFSGGAGVASPIETEATVQRWKSQGLDAFKQVNRYKSN